MRHIPFSEGQTWEAMSGGRGTPKVRRRKVVTIEGGNVAIEEDGELTCVTIRSFRSWISNFGAKPNE